MKFYKMSVVDDLKLLEYLQLNNIHGAVTLYDDTTFFLKLDPIDMFLLCIRFRVKECSEISKSDFLSQIQKVD